MKHWTLFLILISPPIASTLLAENEKELEQMGAIANLIGAGIYFSWIWSVAHFFARKMSVANLNYFKVCFVCSLLGFSCYNIYVFIYGIPVFTYLRAFELLTVALLLYCLYITAKLVKTWKSGKSIKPLDSLGYLFLFLIFPVGVWVLQPIINKSVSTVVND